MKKNIRSVYAFWIFAIGALSCLSMLGGCTQMPTEKQGVSDLRPQISFELTDPAMATAQVMVDGLPMGEVGRYVAGNASLRVLPGTHELKVVIQGRTLMHERFYVGDGVNKTFVIR